MARTSIYPTTTRISLKAARERLAVGRGWFRYAEQLLLKGLAAGRIGWRAVHTDRDGGLPPNSFWSEATTKIDWDESMAEGAEVSDSGVAGAVRFHVYGIELAEAEVLALLPDAPAPAMPGPTVTMKPKQWLRWALKEYPRQVGEGDTAYARGLLPLMRAAPVTKQWEESTLRRELAGSKN